MNNEEIKVVQALGSAPFDTIVGFENRFISGLLKKNSKYTLSMWEKKILADTAKNHGREYDPTGFTTPLIEIHYITNTKDISATAWGFELSDEYDLDSIDLMAHRYAEEVLEDKSRYPTECWILRNQVFFDGEK